MCEPVQALCAKCRQVSVDLYPDTLEYQENFNRILVKREEEPLGIHELALCDPCYTEWQAEQRTKSARKAARSNAAFADYRDRASVTTPKVAWEKVPGEFRHDYCFRERVMNWEIWFKNQKKTSRRGAPE